MRLGLMIMADEWPDASIKAVLDYARRAEELKFDDLWMANIFGLDALTSLALIGQVTEKIGLGTAVTPTYPRHPTAMAQQALTTAAASNNRLTLGIGLSHKMVIEDMLGLNYDKPARHMREYLEVLMPLLRGEQVSYSGDQYRVNAGIRVAGTSSVPCVVAALGPLMLKLAGTLADGTTTWMTGPKTIEGHIAPSIQDAAKDAGKASPSIVCGLPIALTSQSQAARAKLDKSLEIYGILPSYRAMLDREGAAGPGDVAIIGDEKELRQKILQLRDIGVTHFNAAIADVDEGAAERTLAFLADLKPELS
ncbi:MAG: TIGR03564 family F420-dependent LLM class oxidoreductase [Pseudomonadales bacterium]